MFKKERKHIPEKNRRCAFFVFLFLETGFKREKCTIVMTFFLVL